MNPEERKPLVERTNEREPPDVDRAAEDHVTDIAAPLINRKVNHIHKLERKHSSGDLHSRLKTRKLLGVGETDDGDVHRSKLSQILGHSEQLYTRLPKGLRIWQLILAIWFTIVSLWALVLPKSLYKFSLYDEANDVICLPVRLYGTALISFSVVFWSTLRTVDKDLIRWALLSSIVYFVIEILVVTVSMIEMGVFREKASGVLFYRMFLGFVTCVYYYFITEHKPPRARRSNSSHDISATATK